MASIDFNREMAELQARYDAINRAWRDSGIPSLVLQTPDWQSGWRVLEDWLKLTFIQFCDRFMEPGAGLGLWESLAPCRPRTSTQWAGEIHIFSHMYGGNHSPQHAAVEEEGMRAIVAWWNGRSANPDAELPEPRR